MKINVRNLIFDSILILYIIYLIAPIVEFFIPSYVRLFCLAVIWIHMILNKGLNHMVNLLIKIIPLYLIVFFHIILLVINRPEWVVGKIYEVIHLMTISVSYIYMSSQNIKRIRHVFTAVAVSIIITCITTYFGNIIFPGASRISATGWAQSSDLRLFSRYNIGGFDFTYTLVLLMPFVIYAFRTKIFNRMLTLSFIILSVMTVLKTEYTTALLFIFASFGLFLIPPKANPKTMFFICMLLCGAIFISSFAVADILHSLSSNIESSAVSTRLNDIAAVMSGQETSVDSDLDGRVSLWTKSWRIFLNHPFTGSWSMTDGHHSYIIDTLARYGLIGMVALIYFLTCLYKIYIRPYRAYKVFNYLLFYFFIYIFQIFLNPQPYYMAISFIIPIMVHNFVYNER